MAIVTHTTGRSGKFLLQDGTTVSGAIKYISAFSPALATNNNWDAQKFYNIWNVAAPNFQRTASRLQVVTTDALVEDE